MFTTRTCIGKQSARIAPRLHDLQAFKGAAGTIPFEPSRGADNQKHVPGVWEKCRATFGKPSEPLGPKDGHGPTHHSWMERERL